MLLGLSEQFWMMCVKLYLREASEVLKKHVEGDVKRDLRSGQIGVAQRKKDIFSLAFSSSVLALNHVEYPSERAKAG